MEKKYEHKKVEANKNQEWRDKDLFNYKESNGSDKNFSIILPPPNVTGKLHLGHAWDVALQDILIRYKKLKGYNVVWFPGMDHAGIATQAKIEKMLADDGIYRQDLGREKFVGEIWKWKDEYAKTIEEQWGKLGIGLDYSKLKFTLDDDISKLVRQVFVDYYNEGLIYQGTRIIHWDTKLQTAISDIEVEYEEVEGNFYYLKYYLVGEDKYLEVATTRPETIFGDTALAINPNDERAEELVGKKVIIPGVDKEIPIIADEYVDKDFGSGIVKITPAHDPNDYEVGLRHNLSQPIVMNLDGTMNSYAGIYEGQDRFDARKNLIKDLKEKDLVIKIDKHVHNVGHSERSKTIIEPLLSQQWFLKASELAHEALQFQKDNKEIDFFPKRFEDVADRWLNETMDWSISRQLWWGHQIPVWYHKETGEKYVDVNPPQDIENYVQDEDVLDTWFSSSLWPFAVQSEELLKQFYPTSVLVTGYDIIFFWVTRMIFQGVKLTNNIPFDNVLMHGLIRDENGKKMSKSLGNGIDPMDVVDEYGADSLRYFLTTNSTPGQDLRFSKEKLESSWNYINKIWNISRFIIDKQKEMYPNFDFNQNLNEKISSFENLTSADKYIINRFNETLSYTNEMMEKYEFTEVGSKIYTFVWDDFASWYLEASKVILSEGNEEQKEITSTILIQILINILKMLHPFMPFVTEEIYNYMFNEQYIINSIYPEEIEINERENNFVDIKEVITTLRNFKTENDIKPSKMVNIDFERIENDYFNAIDMKILENIGKIENISFNQANSDQNVTFVLENLTINIIMNGLIDHDEQKRKLQEQLIKLESELSRSSKMLSNENFVNRATAEKVNAEKEKANKYLVQYEELLNKNEYGIIANINVDEIKNIIK